MEQSKLEKEQKQINNRIRLLYKQHPKLRDETKVLISILMKQYGLNLSREQKKAFYSMPSMEVLYREARRVRTENNGEIAKKVAPKVQDKRFSLWKFMSGRA
jgi:hypothetical protein